MIECDFDGHFVDYRERLRVSDGSIRCCETWQRIPEGFVYAECEGRMNGELFESFPQALEVWRYLRNQSARHGHCLPFGGVDEMLSEGCYDDDDLMFVIGWRRTKNLVRGRCESGKKARLHPWERASMETDQWFDWIQYPCGGRRFPSGQCVQPPTLAGKPWEPSDDDDLEGDEE